MEIKNIKLEILNNLNLLKPLKIIKINIKKVIILLN